MTTQETPDFDDLERQLAGLTRAGERHGAPELWRTALDSTRTARQSSFRLRPSGRRGGVSGGAKTPWFRPFGRAPLAGGLCVLLFVVIVGIAALPSLQKSGRAASPAFTAMSEMADHNEQGFRLPDIRHPETELARNKAVPDLVDFPISVRQAFNGAIDPSAPSERPGPQPSSAERLVIRKAQLDLETPDVRATYLKATMLISEAQGEYLEESGFSGLGDGFYATMKLRVTTTRLATVLAQLRELGKVTTESAGGEDVTEQMVDLEARLRNEQRIETELLALLESRRGEPLEGVLKLRDSISRVRESIERLTAQRERLSRLVSLATILVTIRTDAVAPEVDRSSDGLGAYFARGFSSAWTTATRGLADSILAIVRIAIGGLLFWIALPFVFLILRALYRRLQRELAAEPPPSL